MSTLTLCAGVIPRAASALFDKLDLPKDRHDVPSPNTVSNFVSQLRNPRAHGQQSLLGDRNWSLKATYVEIYNEQLRDLLVPESTPPHERGNVAIREDAKGNIVLTGLRQMDIYSVDDLMNALNFGSSIRQTDATAINAKSSRSHAVFSLHLVQRKSQLHANSGSEKRFSVPVEAITGREVSVTTDSKLHFVDLAGSERLKNTGAQGDRAKEGISINAGLAALGKVISQLSSRQSASHVSYRDSKLTRLLQDSLGGNAVTYMIACVTPAEFHLSETLNTVQYAQRARAIQSKPRIQSVEDGDNQALIDRLRAEVSFLRDQIRSTSGDTCSPWRGSAPPFERLERQNEREVELQNQLLEAQENYNTLSQRHAKLISEMAKARELESNGVTETILGDSATDRLNRSSSFAEAVEQVVLEYEKTIQTLEQSLSTARISLTNTESSLLEKESKFAYVETINGQLQSRLHKLMERETATETYLRDLEAKLDGHTNGEEKNASIIQELRKETARARGNEASCEEYISTLEERLAEADQDSELMQREIDRLEQVVERQRSLGRLDALLHELDHVEGVKSWENESTNGTTARGLGNLSYHSRGLSHVSRQSQLGDTILEDEELLDRPGRQNRVDTGDSGTEDFGDGESQATERAEGLADQAELQPSRASMSQTKFAADNMEMLCQELVHLRNEHERTVLEFDQLHKKHDDALRTIAELQDVVDEARHPTRIGVRDSVASVTVDTMHMRPLSATFDAKSRSSASRSLSSELSSAIESPATACTSNADDCLDDETTTAKRSESALGESMHGSGSGPLAAELDRLRILAEERGAAERALAEKYAELEFKHNESLLAIENLKAKVHKARAVEANSLRQSTPVIRRKSSQNVMIIDRAHRCFASLRNIASENFEDRPEVMRNFELNLNAAMHELHLRSERIQELEANVASTKKEMETKMTIISGLTRERSSLKAGPMDMSMVVNLRDQLEQSEKQLSELRDSHAARERELVAELENARRNFGSGNLDGEDSVPMRLPETELGALVQQLEARVESLTFELVEAQARTGEEGQDCGHQDLIEFLRGEADGYKTLVQSNANKVIELESALESAKSSLDEMTEAHAEATTDAAQRQELVSELEKKIAAHTDETQTIQAKLETLQSEHVKELADLKVLEQKAYEEQAAVLMAEHGDSIRKLEADIAEIRGDLVKIATQISAALGTDVSIEKLPESIDLLVADHEALVEAQKKEAEMQKHVVELASANEEMRCDLETAKSAVRGMLPGDGNHSVHSNATLADQLSAAHARLSDLESKNKKHIRLVEELEEQLQSNYDEAQMASNRLSTLQSERNAQLEEARTARAKLQSELDAIREDHALLQVSCLIIICCSLGSQG